MAKKEAKQEAEAELKAVEAKQEAVKHVKMQKGDIEADVHPDMVADYAKGGYVEIK